MRNYRKYTDEDIIRISKKVTSIAGLLDMLDLVKAGGNYINIKRKLQLLNVDTSHWTGSVWNKDKQTKDYSEYTRSANIKKHLVKDRGHICSNCNLTEWLGLPIPLELHHKDGNRLNNDPDNVEVLCPNCHACTENYKGKKNKRRPVDK